MSNYTITTNFGAKDSLPSGNAGKVIKGSEFTTEFTNIQTAVATKADTAGDTFTGAVNFSADVAVNTNTLFVDVSENKVGIGTTSPAYKLDVTGSAQLSGGDLILRSDSSDADTQYIRFENYPTDIRTAYIRADYTSQTAGGGTALAFGANDHATSTDTDSMVIDVEGNVGIGTNSPASRLHVRQPSGTQGFLQSRGTEYSSATFEISTDSSKTRLNSYGDGLTFWTAELSGTTAERMRIDSSGKVGIGTTSPDVKLDVTEAYDTVANVLSNGSYAAKFSSSGSGNAGRAQGILLSGQDGNSRGVALLAEAQASNNAHDFVIATSAATSTPTERMRIDASGNVGIGTTSPTQKLQVDGNIRIGDTAVGVDDNEDYNITTGGQLTIHANDSGENVSYVSLNLKCGNSGGSAAASSRIACIVNGDERMRIDSSGKVGIGTSSPTFKLDVAGNARASYFALRSNETVPSESSFIYRPATGVLGFGTGTEERMRIDSSGIVLVGKTATNFGVEGVELRGSPSSLQSVATLTRDAFNVAAFNRLSTNGTIIKFNKDGTTVGSISVTGSATAYNTSSDERLKENITDSADAGSKVDAIQIRQFDWKADGSHQDYGVIAQELINVAPEAVSEGDTEEDMMGVDYSKLVPMLIKEVQSLRSRVAELENV